MNVTDSARERIKATLNGEGYLRVSISGGGCSGFRVALDKEPSEKPNDVRVTETVLCDPTSAEYLTEATLDWKDDPFSPTFKFNIPDTYSCGCGSSFQFEK
jgi:iron-sulfur cluster assembly accessory protein